MSDIVERLRGWGSHKVPREMLDEAATEIERLRGQVDRAKASIEIQDTAIRALCDEIERLQAALREYACTGTETPCGWRP